jgi:hypothetical protein
MVTVSPLCSARSASAIRAAAATAVEHRYRTRIEGLAASSQRDVGTMTPPGFGPNIGGLDEKAITGAPLDVAETALGCQPSITAVL